MEISPALLALTQGVRVRLGLAVVVGIAISAFSLLSLGFAGLAIGATFAGRSIDAVVPLLAGAIAAALARGVLLLVKEVLAVSTAARVKARIRAQLYEHLLALGPSFLERRQTGEVVSRAVDGVEALEAYYGRYLPSLLVTLIAPIGIFVLLGFLHPLLPLVYAVTIALALSIPTLFRKVTRGVGGAFWAMYGAMSGLIVDSVQGLPTLKAFARSRDRASEIAAGSESLARSMSKVFAVNMGVVGLLDLIVVGGSTAALVSAALLVSGGSLPAGTLVIVLLVGNEAFRPIRELNGLFHQGQTAVNAAEGIFSILNSTPEVVEIPTGERVNDASVAFEDVVFAYDGGTRPALNGFSLAVRPGETVALVGPSGAGKSSALGLLLRLHDPRSGTVRVGGVDARHLALSDLRDQFSLVSQDTYLFHGTIAENLRLARPSATDEQIADAARAANIHGFVAGLPAGYATMVGERGLRLSGGQRQRIAIARAILKDAPILLLDEPTSSVDAENEEAIQESLRKLVHGRTTIVVAHRLSTIADADRIVVVEAGRVVEEGRHADLIRAGGTYARLVAAQHDLVAVAA